MLRNEDSGEEIRLVAANLFLMPLRTIPRAEEEFWMVDRDAVMEALKEVRDPELNRSLVDLNMIRDVEISGGKVTVTVALTVKGCPLRAEIKNDVRQKVASLPGVEEVEVVMGVMTDEERETLVRKTQTGRDAKSRIMEPDSPTQIICVASGKGGVGKSTVSANLAVALAQKDYLVGILDCDIYGFSIPRMLGVDGRPKAFNQAIVPLEAYGMQVMSMGFFVDEETPVIWRGPLLMGAVDQFLGDVLWADLDYLIIDLPPGTGDVPLSIVQRLPQSKMVLVTTPQPVSARVAARAAGLSQKAGQEILGVVENMSYLSCPNCNEQLQIFGSGGGRQLAEELGIPLLGQIPLTTEIRTGGDEGRPVVVSEPESEAAGVIREIADRIIELTRTALVAGPGRE